MMIFKNGLISILILLSVSCGEDKPEKSEISLPPAPENIQREIAEQSKSPVPENVKPIFLTKQQETQYFELANSPAVSGLRKRLDEYMDNPKPSECIEKSAIDSTINSQNDVSGLNAFNKDYYKRKFFVISQDIISENKVAITIAFQGRSDRIFTAVFYPGKNCAVLSKFSDNGFDKNSINKFNKMYAKYLDEPRYGF